MSYSYTYSTCTVLFSSSLSTFGFNVHVCSGIVVGLILKYALPPHDAPMYDLACSGDCNSKCASIEQFEVGEDIQLRLGRSDENVVTAEVLGKVFKDSEGNYIEQTVSDSETCL